MEVYANVQKWGQYVILATCDAELLGKILREGKIVFEIHERFYKGPKMTVEEVTALMEQSTIVNMVGHNVVKKAIEKGLVHPDAVLNISGVPHAQIVKM